jgi:hypothetical protein
VVGITKYLETIKSLLEGVYKVYANIFHKGLEHPQTLVSHGRSWEQLLWIPRNDSVFWLRFCQDSEELCKLPGPASVLGDSSFLMVKRQGVKFKVLSSILHCKSRALSLSEELAILKFCSSILKNLASPPLDSQGTLLFAQHTSVPRQFPLLWEMLSCQAALPLNQTTFSSCLYLSK